MLQFTKMARKIIHACVLGCMLRSHARNENEIQTSRRCGSAGKIEKLSFLIPVNPKHAWKSWNLAWCHDMTPTCYGNFLAELGKLWCKFLANWSFPQEGSWFRDGTWHLRVRNDIRTLPSPALIFLHSQIRPNRSIMLNLELFRVRLAFLYINWVSPHLRCIIQIWTTSTCSSAPKLVEKSHVCLLVNL